MFKLRTKKDYSKYEKLNIYITRGLWKKSDHKKFIEALYLYDCDWPKIQIYLKNRTYELVRSHAQKLYNKLKTFKDEELGFDFTYPNVKSLNDIRERINFRKLWKITLYYIRKIIFWKKPLYKRDKRTKKYK